MKPLRHFLKLVFLLLIFTSCSDNKTKHLPAGPKGYIGVCRENPSFFSFSDGSVYIPIGINMINPSGRYRNNPDSAMLEIENWMKNLSANGGNYIRVWLSQSFWDMEDTKAGEYSEEKIKRIDHFVEMARSNGLRIKMTLEHFRSVTLQENNQSWANKDVYHTSNGGPLDSIRQYLTTDEGRQLFLKKVDFYKERYGSDTLFFGWELWNEMNAMKGPEDEVFFNWNEQMLQEVKRRFPENLVMQSFGSFDYEGVRPYYKRLMLMPWNEVAQVHRYLDLGARMEVCHEPMDIICSSAIDEIKSYNPGKPVILAETGAVEPKHSGPSKLYPADTAGILLHDILFAPFFSGSAGAGMSWHWESYVDKNNLWYHFGRFHRAIDDVDPVAENFVYTKSETNRLRVYSMKGTRTNLLWIRDKNNTWQSELTEAKAPELISGLDLDLRTQGIQDTSGTIEIYDPWQDKWSAAKAEGSVIILPDFRRSLIVRIR
ncbi:MAG: cellulase family glycosylhydrolase [Bacteroidia bacterium]|nr:cellulase family glycosylhydrolase [Bacteroidia bacterium]